MLETVILIALVVGITEVVKRIGLNTKWCPLLAIVLGVGLNFIGKAIGAEAGELVIGGLVAGLTAVGLYSGVKNTLQG